MPFVESEAEPRELALVSEAARMLAECTDLDEIRDVRDKAEAVRLYAKKAGHGLEAQNHAAKVKLLAERRAGELLRGMEKAKGAANGAPGPGRGNKTPSHDESAFPTLADMGLTYSQSHRWQTIAELSEPEIVDYVERATSRNMEATSKEAYATGKKKRAKKTVDANGKTQRNWQGPVTDSLESLTGQKFGAIYADPPWRYGNQATRASTDNHYPTMSVDELCEMPVAELVADDAHLHLWTTNAFLPESFRVIEAWGFEYRSTFVWVKPQLGIGNYWRVSHEFLLLGVRGDALCFAEATHRSWAEYDRTRHSSKPEQLRGVIERVSPGPFLELFGRFSVPGWTVFGNQVEPTLFD